jgi:hypothetical protein
MGMLLECGRAGSVAGAGLVAVQANLIDRLRKLRVVLRAMHVVAIEAGFPAAVHDALNEIVAQNAVLVRRAVRKNG